MNKFRKITYAKIKGVVPSYITKLCHDGKKINGETMKLETEIDPVTRIELVLDTPYNDKFFEKK